MSCVRDIQDIERNEDWQGTRSNLPVVVDSLYHPRAKGRKQLSRQVSRLLSVSPVLTT